MSNAENFGKAVDSLGVVREVFQAELRNAVGGAFASGGTSLAVWGAGAVLDGYSVYESGDYTYAAGSVAGNPYTGKAGAVVGGWDKCL